MIKEVVYFAHPVTDYDTERERRSLDILDLFGFEVVNPNSPEHEAVYKERGMQYFVELVNQCEGLVFQRFPDGEIGAGVGKEIMAAETGGKPVFEIGDSFIDPSSYREIEPDILSVDATRALIARLRETKSN